MTQVTEPFPIFYDDDGTPLENGMIYIGQVNQDPRANPVVVYTDFARTIPIAQPIRTLNGRPAFQGAPINLYVAEAKYSIAIQNRFGTPIVSVPDGSDFITSRELAASDGSDLVGFIQSGAGAVARTVQDKAREIVSVKDFRAVGDGAADDTAAIQAALNSGAVSVFFPAGRYRVTANLTRSGHTYLYGETMTSSILQMEGTASFVYTGGTAGDEYDTKQLQIERLSFECPTVADKSVIDASWTAGIGGTSKTFIMRDCEITGTAPAGGFRDAVKLTNARNIVVESVRILGDRDAPPITSAKAFDIVGGTTDGAPVEMFFNKVQCFFVRTAISVAGWVEGVYVHNCTIIACRYGIMANASPGQKPLILVTDSHINTDASGIVTGEFVQLFYSGNLIYGENGDGVAASYVAIQMTTAGAALDALITDNQLQGILTGKPKNGIVVLGGAGVEDSIIGGNLIIGFDTGIILQAGSSNVVVRDDNAFKACTTNILNSGANTVCVFNPTTGEKRFPDGFVSKWGSISVTLNAGGDGSIGFDPVFPNAYLSATICNGDPGVAGDASFVVNHAASTASMLAFSVRPNPGAVTVRVNWTAQGR